MDRSFFFIAIIKLSGVFIPPAIYIWQIIAIKVNLSASPTTPFTTHIPTRQQSENKMGLLSCQFMLCVQLLKQ